MTGNGPDDRFMKIFAHGLGRLAPKLDLGSCNMIMLDKSKGSRGSLLI